MPLLYGKHKVRNYNDWRPLFDQDNDRRTGMGIKVVSVMQSTDNPNEVHFVFDVPDAKAFASFLQDPKMAEVMQKAGVLEKPTVYTLQEGMAG